MPATYEPIATTTLGSSSTSISFTGIGSGYTDLRIIVVGRVTSTGSTSHIQFNSDTGSNYSSTVVYGDGASAASYRSTIRIIMNSGFDSTTSPTMVTADIFSYAGSTNKTVLATNSGDINGAGGGVERSVGLWRSTSAITSVQLLNTNGWASGTTATLYGILRAT